MLQWCPEKTAAAATVRDGQFVYTEWGPQGQAPEVELYPDAAEHYRAYMFKYMPIRSFFDAQSQLRNFKAPDIPGAGPGLIEQYAEPVYWVPRHASVVNTGKHRTPVPVIRCRPETPVLSLDLGRLEPGLYAVRVIGAVETEHLKPFRRPLVICMTINDGLDGGDHVYRVRGGYCDQFYSVAEIYFHAPEARDYKATLALDALIVNDRQPATVSQLTQRRRDAGVAQQALGRHHDERQRVGRQQPGLPA